MFDAATYSNDVEDTLQINFNEGDAALEIALLEGDKLLTIVSYDQYGNEQSQVKVSPRDLVLLLASALPMALDSRQ